MKNLTFITGAARSGKSLLAEELAANSARPVFYLASLQIFQDDPEQLSRVKAHQERRPTDWQTIDAPFSVEKVVADLPDGSLVIFDCLSLYVTNMLIANSVNDFPGKTGGAGSEPASLCSQAEASEDPYARENEILSQVDHLLAAMQAKSNIEFIVVSNEVGWGVVPETKLARAFRDILGLSNQKLAAASEKAYLTCAGLRIQVK